MCLAIVFQASPEEVPFKSCFSMFKKMTVAQKKGQNLDGKGLLLSSEMFAMGPVQYSWPRRVAK